MKEDKLQNILQDAFANPEVDFNAEHWDAMEQKLDARNRKRRLVYFFWSAIAALVFSAGIYFLLQSGEADTAIASAEQVQAQKSVEVPAKAAAEDNAQAQATDMSANAASTPTLSSAQLQEKETAIHKEAEVETNLDNKIAIHNRNNSKQETRAAAEVSDKPVTQTQESTVKSKQSEFDASAKEIKQQLKVSSVNQEDEQAEQSIEITKTTMDKEEEKAVSPVHSIQQLAYLNTFALLRAPNANLTAYLTQNLGLQLASARVDIPSKKFTVNRNAALYMRTDAVLGQAQNKEFQLALGVQWQPKLTPALRAVIGVGTRYIHAEEMNIQSSSTRKYNSFGYDLLSTVFQAKSIYALEIPLGLQLNLNKWQVQGNLMFLSPIAMHGRATNYIQYSKDLSLSSAAVAPAHVLQEQKGWLSTKVLDPLAWELNVGVGYALNQRLSLGLHYTYVLDGILEDAKVENVSALSTARLGLQLNYNF